MKKSKLALFQSVMALILCFSMLAGTTFAWFTDSVSSGSNIIQSGNLDVSMQWTDDLTADSWKDASEGAIFDYQNWEPGFTDLKYLKIENLGNLAFQYQLSVLPADPAADTTIDGGEVGSENAGGIAGAGSVDISNAGNAGSIDGGDLNTPITGAAKLAEVIDVYYGVVDTKFATREEAISGLRKVGTLSQLMNQGVAQGILLPVNGSENAQLPAGVEAKTGEEIACIMLKMQETAGNEYMGIEVTNGFRVELKATQYTYEIDAFGNDYDTGAVEDLSGAFSPVSASGLVTVENGMTTEETTIGGATIPAGVQVTDGTTELTLTIAPKSDSEANVTLGENEEALSLDVHIDGVAEGNQTVMIINLGVATYPYLNQGNIKLYHVEDGLTNEMTRADTLEELDAHNEFYYDVATGNVTVALATFSEVALVVDTVNAWNGTVATAFAGGTGTEADPYIIANADQLAYMGDQVSNDNTNYGSAYYKLIADINIGGVENYNTNGRKVLWYPIGYNKVGGTTTDKGNWYTYGGAFSGTFDGTGHTITGIYQNTWAMVGDYSGTYYNDAMGLFGYVNGGTVKNLTIDNFYSEGEFAPTGCITAYAAGEATFENIAITKSHPQTYNTGVAGIVGWDEGDSSNFTFKNITVDSTNTISALWGSWDVAAAGLLGYLGPNSKANLDNCHVSATIDVYNDVCGNYQYYWYRYCGMLIGTVDKRLDNGKGALDLSNITATNCTVDFGDRHEYYYCEFEKNTQASYTEDYQFSRVDHSELNMDANPVTCKHTHTDKEDKQAVYIPFRQLFGGYGWGVDGVDLGENLAANIQDVTHGKADSTADFVAKSITELPNSQDIPISRLFSASATGEINSATVVVGVTDLDDTNGIVTAVYTANETDWALGTLNFTGTGKVRITIQDYEFSTPVYLEVEIKNAADITETERFAYQFPNTDKYLYRVGNKNEISISRLFKAIDGEEANIGNVEVTVEAASVVTRSQNYAYTSGSAWNNGMIDFTDDFTGPVTITISDDNYSKPLSLDVEVINATNITSATGTTTGGDMVLLCDVNTTSYVNYWNCTLYGNGFTYSLKDAPTDYNSKQGHGVLITKNATLDNLVIIGDVYNSYGAYTTQGYYNAAVDVAGDTIIQNCYIANCAAPVSTRDDVTIKNTTLYGGTVANLIIKSGTATLENVTTANYDDSRSLIGMGIVIHSDATESAKLVLNGELTQYNFIDESKAPTDTNAKNLYNAMFSDSCSKYHFGTSPNRSVNTGIISLTTTFDNNDITDNANTGYVGQVVSASGFNGYVYTQPNTSGSVNNGYDKDDDDHVSTTQGVVPPSYTFDYTTKNYQAKQDGSNDYCYEENGTVYISMDEGDTFSWDTSILTVTKNGENLDYKVSMNGTDYTGKSINFDTAGEYEVVYTYTDDNNYELSRAITTTSQTYTKTVHISVAVIEAETKHAEFTFGSSNTASTTVTIGNNTYVMPNVSATSSTIGSTTVSGQTIYYPIVEIVMSDGKTSHTSDWYAYFPVFSGAVTITDYKDNGVGDAETFRSSTTTMPSGLSIVGDPAQLFKYQSSSTAGTSPDVQNNILVYSSPAISANRNEYNTVIQYSYQDNAGATYYYYIGYHAPAQTYSSCITPDTLITLADGSQVRVDSLTGSEELLVWNHETGAFENAPVAYIVNHDEEVKVQEITQLSFSDGSEIKIIGEHVFFNATLNRYIPVTSDNAKNYIGHVFTGINRTNDALTAVKLEKVESYVEETSAYEVVSYKHLTCFTNNLLSTSAYLDKLLNIFDINPATMAYSADKVVADIAKYGLYTYADFEDLISEEAFELYNAAYLKIAVGKGYITWDDILDLIDIYFAAEVNPIQ